MMTTTLPSDSCRVDQFGYSKTSATGLTGSPSAMYSPAKEHILLGVLGRARQLLDETASVLREDEGYEVSVIQRATVIAIIAVVSETLYQHTDSGRLACDPIYVFPYGDSGIEVSVQSKRWGCASIIVDREGRYEGAVVDPMGGKSVILG